MQGLRKDDQLNIRMQKKVKAKIRRAARIESRRRQRIVEPGPLLLELGLPGIERILTGSSASEPAERLAAVAGR